MFLFSLLASPQHGERAMFRFTLLVLLVVCAFSVVGCGAPGPVPPSPTFFNDGFNQVPSFSPELPSFTPPSFDLPSMPSPSLAP
jgi:hypothetical protein